MENGKEGAGRASEAGPGTRGSRGERGGEATAKNRHRTKTGRSELRPLGERGSIEMHPAFTSPETTPHRVET
jgi:hypothetical protein